MARGLGAVFGGVASAVAKSAVLAAAGAPGALIAAVEGVDAVKTGREVVGYISPYALGNYRAMDPQATDNYLRNGTLPLTSVARLGTRRTDDGSGRTFGAHDYLAQFISPEQESRETGILVPGGAGAVLAEKSNFRRFVAPGQEQRQLDDGYDYGRIRAEIDTLASTYRDNGLDKPADPNAALPMQTIRDNEGRVLMQGPAQSPEALIAQKLKEAETATDPSRRVVNLAGANLEGMNFKGFNFNNVDMRGASLKGSEFDNCKFENVDAEGANLKGAKFRNTHFENVNLNGFEGDKDTKFSGVSMVNVHMVAANAPQMKVEGLRAENLNIAGANFKGSTWSDVQVHNLWAVGAHLEGAKLGNFHVAGPDSSFDGAYLTGAKINNASFGTPGQGIPMRGMHAENTEWSDVQFNSSDISGSNFSNAHFKKNVDMRNVTTRHGPAIMEGANLTGLKAGRECKIQASCLTYGEGADQVVMRTKNGLPMIFNGTGDIENLHKIARSNNLSSIHISDDGIALDPISGKPLSEQINAPGLVQARRPKPALMNDPFAGGPSFKKKDTPW